MSNVEHPSHYVSHPSGVECIDLVEHLDFNLGNAIKYLWRAGLKERSTANEDLSKALWYLRRSEAQLERMSSELNDPCHVRLDESVLFREVLIKVLSKPAAGTLHEVLVLLLACTFDDSEDVMITTHYFLERAILIVETQIPR